MCTHIEQLQLMILMTSPTMTMCLPVQNHVHRGHRWSVTIVPLAQTTEEGPYQGRFGGVLLETSFKQSIEKFTMHIMLSSPTHDISNKWWLQWQCMMTIAVATLKIVCKYID